MSVTLVSVGESSESGDLAFMDAMAQIAPAINEAASAVLISRDTQITASGGFQVSIRIVLFDEGEVAHLLNTANIPDEEPLSGEAKLVQDKSEDYLALYAARLHNMEVAQATEALMEEGGLSPVAEAESPPYEFEEVAEPAPASETDEGRSGDGDELLSAFAVSESAGGPEAPDYRRMTGAAEPELNPVA